MAQKEFTKYFPKPGWAEHDAGEIWSTMLGVAVEAMQKAGAEAADIASIGITNQRETVSYTHLPLMMEASRNFRSRRVPTGRLLE